MSRVGFSPAGWNGAMKMPKRMRLMCPPSCSPMCRPGRDGSPGGRLSGRGGARLLAGQRAAQDPERLEGAALDRAERQAEPVGDLLLREVVEVGEVHQLALAGREADE